MSRLRPFRSSRSIGGVECDFPSREELLGYLSSSQGFTHIITLNSEMVVEAQRNGKLKSGIQDAELVLPDSAGIMWAKEYLSDTTGSRSFFRTILSLIRFIRSDTHPIPGVDLIFDICTVLQESGGTVYLVGSSEDERTAAAKVLEHTYPGLSVIAGSDDEKIQYGANSAVLVAYGVPKQSLWIEEHRDTFEKVGVRVAVGVGGALAMITGTLPRAPRWMRRYHLEWLWRLLLEPHRVRRIWNAIVIFPKIIAQE